MGRRERAAPLGPLESAVMEALWQAQGPQSVRQVLDILNGTRSAPLAYTTVMTVLSRLTERGLASREKAGRGYLYCAQADSLAEVAVRRVLEEHGHAALASFVDQVSVDEQLRDRLRRLVGES